MTARVIQFPPHGPFVVHVEREEAAWLVICRGHGWLHAGFREAITEAYTIARGFGVAVAVHNFLTTTAQRFSAPIEPIIPRNTRGNTPMTKDFDDTNRGAMFRADKQKENDRDYSGTLNVNGVDYWVSGWLKTSKKGTKFLSLSVKPKNEVVTASKKPIAAELDDEILF